MIIQKGYKTEINPNNKQRTALHKHTGVARFAFNWGLNLKIQAMKVKEKIPNAIKLHKQLNKLKQTDFSWMYEVSKCAPQEALRNLDKAFDNFFKKRAKFPRFKSKKNGIGNFRLYGTINITESHIQLPRLGKLKLKEKGYLPVKDIKILSATVSEKAGRWYVSVQVEQELPEFTGQKDEHDIIGVDLGIKTLAVCSDGKTFDNPKPLKKRLKKLRKLQRKASRAKKGGANRRKTVKLVAKLHQKVANIRKDTLHKITTILAKTKRIVGVEDLNVSGMMKNRKLSRSIADLGLFEFKRQLNYKCNWYNCCVVVVDRFYPSSKICSKCGFKNQNLTLSDREWTCEGCGIKHNRDFNASCNLEKVAVSSIETINAYEERRPLPLTFVEGKLL